MVTLLMFGYWGILFLIFPVIFSIIQVKETQTCDDSLVGEQEKTLFQKLFVSNGDINKMIVVEIILSWILSFIIMVFSHFNNITGLGFALPFMLYFPAQIYHFINLTTATKNQKKLKSLCIVFSIPEVYVLTLGFVGSWTGAF